LISNLKRDAWKLREKIDLVKNPFKKARLMREYASLINTLEASPSFLIDVTYEYREVTIMSVGGMRYHLLALTYCVLRKLRLL